MAETNSINDFDGYHSEWNLGSPGGWYYQLETQKLGRFIWDRVSRITGLSLPLDFEHPVLNSPPLLRDIFFRAHENRWGKGEKPGIALLAEEETLETVVENRRMVEYLKRQPGTQAVLAAPGDLVKIRSGYYIGDIRITVAFCDFNNSTIVELERSGKAGALPEAVSDHLTVNPRGMEPVGYKGIFEAVTGTLRNRLSPGTVSRTPWTRRFYPRKTAGSDGSPITDLVEWTRLNWPKLVLKPEHGYSGKGVFVGDRQQDADKCIQSALDHGKYIVQQMIPPGLWAELYPETEPGGSFPVLRAYQTDFRCLIGDAGLIGFVGRWGGIPTNVGSGGGTQAVAIVNGDPGEAARRVCEAMERMPASEFDQLREEVGQKALSAGLRYLKGPIPQAMRPRIISLGQLAALEIFARDLWQDCVKIEKWWREGLLDEFLHLPEEEKTIAGRQAWNGSPALVASDGLYSFGADLLTGKG
ncbi:MAG TPA: hypothetical protein VM123_12265 [archaeon]|nr:hypothetical protein [archaeon]